MYRTSKPNCYWSFHNKICTCKFSKRLNLYSKRFELKFILLFSLLHCFLVRISTIAHPTTFLFPIHKRNCTCEVDITCLQLFKKKPCLFPILKARDWKELKNENVDKVLGTLEYKKIFFSGLTYPKQCWIFQNFELFKKKKLVWIWQKWYQNNFHWHFSGIFFVTFEQVFAKKIFFAPDFIFFSINSIFQLKHYNLDLSHARKRIAQLRF